MHSFSVLTGYLPLAATFRQQITPAISNKRQMNVNLSSFNGHLWQYGGWLTLFTSRFNVALTIQMHVSYQLILSILRFKHLFWLSQSGFQL